MDYEIVFGLLFMLGTIFSLAFILNKKINLKSITLFILGALVIFSPRIIFEFRHQFLMTKSFFSFFITGHSSQSYNFLEKLINRIGILFNDFNFAATFENKVLGLVAILFTLFTILIFLKNASEIVKKITKTALIILATFFLGILFFNHDIWPHYLTGLPIIYILLLSISISLFAQKTNNYLVSCLIVLFLFLLNLNPIGLINNLSKPLWVGDASVYRNQLKVIDFVYEEAKGKEFRYVVYKPPVHDYTYRYLFKWYGLSKYHYSPNDSSHLAFFILEPDTQYPFRLTDWLKLREKDGRIIKIEKFASGIVVQTRITQ